MKDFLLTVHKTIPVYHKKVQERVSRLLFFKLQRFFLCLIPVLLFILLLVFNRLTNQVDAEQYVIDLKSVPFTIPTPALYPDLSITSFASISAQASEILDTDSGVVLFSKNSKVQFSMASTTKIMTALVAIDYYKMDDVLTVQDTNIEPVVVGFPKGERIRFADMLYAMLLPSGNDAAVAIADNYPGGRSAFVAKMNEKAADLHLNHTHFIDPSGLEDGDVTTAQELARLAEIAMENPTFAKVVGTKMMNISNANNTYTYHLENINKLLGVDGVDGIKTGFTDEAGQVLVTTRLEQGHRLILVVMRSEDRFGDTSNLLNSIQGAISYIKL